jgi:hypothetical protein
MPASPILSRLTLPSLTDVAVPCPLLLHLAFFFLHPDASYTMAEREEREEREEISMAGFADPLPSGCRGPDFVQ